MEVFVILIAVLLGFGWSFLVLTILLHKGNNFGTDTGDYIKYADKPINYIKMEDNIKRIN